jgi:hypothetical protein
MLNMQLSEYTGYRCGKNRQAIIFDATLLPRQNLYWSASALRASSDTTTARQLRLRG